MERKWWKGASPPFQLGQNFTLSIRPFLLRIPPSPPDNPGVTMDGLRLSREQAWPNRPPSPRQQEEGQSEGGEEAAGANEEAKGEESDDS